MMYNSKSIKSKTHFFYKNHEERNTLQNLENIFKLYIEKYMHKSRLKSTGKEKYGWKVEIYLNIKYRKLCYRISILLYYSIQI